MANVLVNRHHSDLFWSMYLLFEKRFGWNLYVPKGMEWFDQGYFRMHEHPEKEEPSRYMANWFLVNEFYGNKSKHTFMGCPDYPLLKPLTLEEANDTQIDIIISTNRENDIPFEKYRNEHHPKAKLVRQMGNRHDRTHYPNIMISDKESFDENEGHKILYHQEFDLEIFKFKLPESKNFIFAFQHNLEKYEPAEKLWEEHRRIFLDFDWTFYGKGNDGGYIYSKREYASLMRMADFIWQVKDWDGYCHIIHNAMAVGRPMIVRRSDIRGKIFEPLLDETTAIFIEDGIERIRDVDVEKMSQACYRRFKEVVDFDAEEIELRKFFEDLR